LARVEVGSGDDLTAGDLQEIANQVGAPIATADDAYVYHDLNTLLFYSCGGARAGHRGLRLRGHRPLLRAVGEPTVWNGKGSLEVKSQLRWEAERTPCRAAGPVPLLSRWRSAHPVGRGLLHRCGILGAILAVIVRIVTALEVHFIEHGPEQGRVGRSEP